jgi:hypothetical protein
MRNLALALGSLGVLGLVLVGACGTDVETEPGDTTTVTGTGGSTSAGGGGSTTTTTTTTTTTSDGGNCAGVGGACEAACCKIEEDCGFPVTCAMAGDMLDCENNQPAADCFGQCIVDADCSALPTLVIPGEDPDPDLCACIEQCPGGADLCSPCTGCLVNSCQTQFGACQQDGNCTAFMNCVQTNACQDLACMTDCQTQNPGQATDDLVACACGTCGNDCAMCGAGTGGAGGGT